MRLQAKHSKKALGCNRAKALKVGTLVCVQVTEPGGSVPGFFLLLQLLLFYDISIKFIYRYSLWLWLLPGAIKPLKLGVKQLQT